ncbi:MAG: hypothetical protein FWD31_10775, partial [Planctomycetaceae bacterium]|nr:hypothetical protein [Planctomycetaceae bacterium]
ARDLLTHVNPYTGLSYTQDPCVAMVEISNEDSIVSEWSGGRTDSLPEPYGGLFRKLWNDWLREKYNSTEQLREAWNSKTIPLGDEMCLDLDFETDRSLLTRRLVLQTDAKSKAEMWVVDKTLKLKVTEMGEAAWIPQIFYTNVPMHQGAAYTLTVRMRSDKETTVLFGVRRNAEPWDDLGGRRRVSLTPEWQTFDVSFYATDTCDAARIDIGGFSADVIYEIAGISLRPGGAFGVKTDQTLEAGNLPLISPFDSDALPSVAARDFVEFLFRIEQNYWLGMYDFLKNDLKVQAPVAGTQMHYGSMIMQSLLDYCDNHSYWHHPSFPGRAWDMAHWYVRNVSLANSADTGSLSRLAAHRVLGKPYTVSEYDHPFPNEYNAEGQPMIAAMGRFQDWDGIFPFAYAHSNNFEPDYVTSFFDSVGNVGRIAHTIACHTMFVRGDVTVGHGRFEAGLTLPREIEIVAHARSPWASRWGKMASLGESMSLLSRVGVNILGNDSAAYHVNRDPKHFVSDTGEITRDMSAPDRGFMTDDRAPKRFISDTGEITRDMTAPDRGFMTDDRAPKRFVSDTGEIYWDMTTPERGFMTVNTTNTKLFSGFVPDDVVALGDVTLAVGKTRLGWTTVSLVSKDATGFGGDGQAAKLLVAATGKYVNTDMTIEQLGDDRITVGNRFGRGPVLCEGIPAVLTLPAAAERVTLYPLDASGNRKEPVQAKPAASEADDKTTSTVELSPQYETLWYEIEITGDFRL